MIFRAPKSPAEIQSRNELLQLALRPSPPIFAIKDEYPIVLANDHLQHSLCCFENDELIAHANLWPRRLLDSTRNIIGNVGLIGNVATRSDMRGRGVMKSLFDQILQSAEHQGLDALILWSDLSAFYQKMSYFSLSDEHRWKIDTLPHLTTPSLGLIFEVHQGGTVLEDKLKQLLELRPTTAFAIERTLQEFRLLVQIPATFVATFTASDNSIAAYAIIGKGYDLVGVVHEWGFRDPKYVIPLLANIRQDFDIPGMIFLSPAQIDIEIERQLSEAKLSKSKHPMALARLLNPNLHEELQKLFIWGLDSI